MSPALALQNGIFLAYVAIVAGLLALAGAALALLTWGRGRDVGPIWLAYRGWLWMAPLAFGLVFLGRVPTVLGVGLVSLLGLKEFARATGLYRDWWHTGVVYLGILGITFLALWPDSPEGHPGLFGLFRVWPVYAIALILMIPILRNQVEGQLQRISLAIVGFVYVGWMFGHLAFLADSTHAYGYLLYLLLAVQVNDVAAFTFGQLFGRHKLRPAISPNKTLEGSLGALAVSLALPWLLWFSFPHFGPAQLLLTGLIVGVGGQLGDLSISVIKRDLGVKDMGSAIPGHGGVLDRIDSLIYTTPLFAHMVHFFYGLW